MWRCYPCLSLEEAAQQLLKEFIYTGEAEALAAVTEALPYLEKAELFELCAAIQDAPAARCAFLAEYARARNYARQAHFKAIFAKLNL